MEPITIIMIVIVAIVFVGMLIMPMFTNKKRNAQQNDLYTNLAPGDEIMTIGGIVATVLEIEEVSPVDKRILIESGAEGSKTTLWLDIKGIFSNLSKPAQETNFFGKPKAGALEDNANTATKDSSDNADVPKEEN